MTFRPYNPSHDLEAARRIWYEVGWLDRDRENDVKGYGAFIDPACCDAYVAEIDGAAECLVAMASGQIRHLDTDLPLAGVMGVTTSHVARKQGFASRLTAHAIAQSVAKGAAVAGLGMFEQGYYNRLGFGSGSYEHHFHFDPMELQVPGQTRPPRRVTLADAAAVHVNRIGRLRTHGAVNFDHVGITESEMLWTRGGFGLGYYDGPKGELSHHVWLQTEDMEYGPVMVQWMVYHNNDELMELLGLLKGLGDQMLTVQMHQPPNLNLQDLLRQPIRERRVRHRSKYESACHALAFWQMRICDVPACLAATHVPGGTVQFNVRIHDPIASHLPEDAAWRGCSGDYTVTIGPESSAVDGHKNGLPLLDASLNAFTRLWLGVANATTLNRTDHLNAPPELLAQLDNTLRLPQPFTNWEF